MHYTPLGRSGLSVSPLCLGTMMFGEQTPEADSRRIIDSAFAQGINFIDTANVYNGGESERVTGRAIAGNRHDWVLATKFGSPTGQQAGLPHKVGGSRKHLIHAAEQSLERLGTDYIDVYYLHREDHQTPIEETVSALGDLIRQGKVRYWALSNHRGWKIAEFANTARRLGVDAPVAVQPLYNLVNRQAEQEVFTACQHYGLGIVPYSPLARGVLTGKYLPGEPPAEGTRAGRHDKRLQETEWRAESLALAQQIAAHAKQRGVTPTAFAIAWVLNNRLVSSAIVGPRTLEHWEGYLPALEYRLDADDEAFIDRLVIPGHASTPGFNDVAHFVSGRPVR